MVPVSTRFLGDDLCCVRHQCVGNCAVSPSGRRLTDQTPALAIDFEQSSDDEGRRLTSSAGGLSACELDLPLSLANFTAGPNDQTLQSIIGYSGITDWLLSLARNDMNNVVCSFLSSAVSQPMAGLLLQVREWLEPQGTANTDPRMASRRQ